MGNTYTNLLYHIVFSTKDRLPIIQPPWRERLYAYLGGIVRAENGILLEIGGTVEHAHLLAKLSPVYAVADVVGKIKANSSRWINEQRLLPVYFSWQRGYAAFSVSESNVSRLQGYIRSQERHHLRISFEDELRRMLEKNRINFSPEYLL